MWACFGWCRMSDLPLCKTCDGTGEEYDDSMTVLGIPGGHQGAGPGSRLRGTSMRKHCPFCGRHISTYVPSGGDGSWVRFRKHKTQRGSFGKTCEGSFDGVPA